MINSLWNKLDSGLSSVENAAMVLILFGMLVLAVAQILLRNVSGGGLIWIDPLLRIAVLWIAMIGAMIGTRTKAAAINKPFIAAPSTHRGNM